MKTIEITTRKAVYGGAAVGLLLFALVGLLPSSYIGGVMGLQLASQIFGTPSGLAVLPRAAVGIGMVLAVAVTGIVFVGGASLMGWFLGYMGRTIVGRRAHRMA